MKIVAGVGAVVATISGIVALVTQLSPDEEAPPAERAGVISSVTLDPNLTAAAFQSEQVSAPRRCPGFDRPETTVSLPRSGQTAAGGTTFFVQYGTTGPTDQQYTTTTPDPTTDTIPDPTTDTTDTTDTNGEDGPGGILLGDRFLEEAQLVTGEVNPTVPEVAEAMALTFIDPNAEGADSAERLASGDFSKDELAVLLEDAAPALIGNAVNFDVEVRGLAGRCSYVRASIWDAKKRQRLSDPAAQPRDALFFVPRALRDSTSSRMWLPRPAQPGAYFVRLELFDEDASRLDHNDEGKFKVGG